MRKAWQLAERNIAIQIEKMRCVRSTLFLALIWLLFMMFFTYTTLFVELIKVDGNFSQLFYDEQSKYISLCVNIGLVTMLLFDNHVVNKKFNGIQYYIPFFGVVIALFLMEHCSLIKSGEYQSYIRPISCGWLSYVIYSVFLVILYILKVRSLKPEEIEVKKSI